MTAEVLGLAFEAENVPGTIREIGRVEAAQRRVEERAGAIATSATSQSGQIAAAQRTQAEAIEGAGRKWGELAGAVGNVGAVFGQTNPVLGQAGSLVGAIGSASTALTGALGPVGVALAVVTTAAGFLVPILQDTDEELENVGDEAENTADRFDRLVASIRDARDSFDSMFRAAGEDALQDAQDRLTAVNRQLQQLNQLLTTAQRAGDTALIQRLQGRISEAELQRGALELSQSVIQGNTAREEQARAEEERRRGRGRGGPSLADQIAEAQDRANEALERGLERERMTRERHAAQIQDAYNEVHGFFRELDEETKRRTIESIEQQEAAMERLADLAKRQQEEAAAAQREKADEAKAVSAQSAQFAEGQWQQFTGTVNGAIGQLVKQTINLEEASGDAWLAMLDSFLEATSIEYTIKALGEAANAAAAFARQDYVAGPQHLIAAGLAAAVAAATGLGAAAIPNQAQPSGGQVQPNAPTGQQPTGDIYVNLYAPNTVMTEAEQGQLIGNMTRAARREFGARAA